MTDQGSSIGSPEEARVFTAAAITVIHDLRAVLDEETSLIRAAQFTTATALSERKVGLVNSYAQYMTTARLEKQALRQLAPEAYERLVAAHDQLSEAAQDNMPTIARARDTTHRVLNSIGTLVAAKRSGPTTYGPLATEASRKPASASPMALNRAI